MALAHGGQRFGLRRLDTDEHADEIRLVHQLQNVRLLGDVERGLAGELHRIVMLLLPFDEMRQHLLGGFAIADEVIVDEVDHRRRIRLRAHEIELGNDLLRGLHARLSSIETRDVAEFAQIRAARRELHRPHQVAAERYLVIGGLREFGERQPIFGLKYDLLGRRRGTLIDQAEDRVGAIAELADVQVVEARVHLRRG